MKHHHRKLSRRGFLKGSAAASIGTVAAGSLAGAVEAQSAPPPTPPHGAELRGMSLPAKQPLTEARFGYMVKNMPAYSPANTFTTFQSDLEPIKLLGQKMLEQHDPNPDIQDTWNESPNEAMTAGTTFIGQFIDHDITFDTTDLAQQVADPDALRNFRSPRYDLDSLYGRGPSLDPQLYGHQGGGSVDRTKFNIKVNSLGMEDIPREADGKAIIGDPRNDQHMVIAQLHLAFMKFHNKLVDYNRAMRIPAAAVFEAARRMARWHYQWMVIHHYLPTIVGQEMRDSVYRDVAGNKPPVINLKYYKPADKAKPFIPLEFAVAAFRFGHSLARPRYTTSETIVPNTTAPVKISKIPLFSDDPAIAYDAKLNGSREIPPRLIIQWSRFWNPPAPAAKFSKRTRQIDSRLSEPLHKLPATALPDSNPENVLATRNLLRGRKLNLPSGQEMARRMGVTPLTNEQLAKKHVVRLNKDTFAFLQPESSTTVWPNGYEISVDDDAELKPIITDAAFNGEVPLWFYILKEAELLGKTRQLGPVGGRIVAETLVGLLLSDKNSYLYLNPGWKPAAPLARKDSAGKLVLDAKGLPIFEMYDLLNYAGVWS